jgi:hypothetical protein
MPFGMDFLSLMIFEKAGSRAGRPPFAYQDAAGGAKAAPAANFQKGWGTA